MRSFGTPTPEETREPTSPGDVLRGDFCPNRSQLSMSRRGQIWRSFFGAGGPRSPARRAFGEHRPSITLFSRRGVRQRVELPAMLAHQTGPVRAVVEPAAVRRRLWASDVALAKASRPRSCGGSAARRGKWRTRRRFQLTTSAFGGRKTYPRWQRPIRR